MPQYSKLQDGMNGVLKLPLSLLTDCKKRQTEWLRPEA